MRDERLAARLAALRVERGWSLDELAQRSGISRSTLSRLERTEISPTAAMLGKLCQIHGLTMSRLLAEVESESPQLLRVREQAVWRDAGFSRRQVSPPQTSMRGELIECVLEPGADISYDGPPVKGMEQHVWVLDGLLELSLDRVTHRLEAGDCLRLRLWGSSRFHCPGPDPARYAVVVVLP
jgi:transcriptional regulator with XRE-family HTH domain